MNGTWPTLLVIAALGLGGRPLVAAEPAAATTDAERVRRGETRDGDWNERVNFGIGVRSEFGLVVQFTYENRRRGVSLRNVAIPISVLARPTAEGLAAFVDWYLEEGRVPPNEDDEHEDGGEDETDDGSELDRVVLDLGPADVRAVRRPAPRNVLVVLRMA